MWIASLVSNITQTHWLSGAKWMFYHLLDGDLASNFLSWQWVAGAFSSKKYFANQDNINKYSPSKHSQKNTFLDTTYEELPNLPIPQVFQNRSNLNLSTNLQSIRSDKIQDQSTFLYSIWSLNPNLPPEIEDKIQQKVLLLEPDFFKQFPVSEQRIAFILGLAKNIKSLKILVSNIKDIHQFISPASISYYSHPGVNHWSNFVTNSIETPKLFPNVQGYFPSFFSYWKQIEKTNK